jgi:L-fucose mutarotase
MLKGIPHVISPELLKILDEMGHADELVIGDSNFPAASNARRLVRADGVDLISMLDAVLKLYPLDAYVPRPVGIMHVVKGDTIIPTIHERIKETIARYDERGVKAIEMVERFAFYERARGAYAIVATTEQQPYACVILKKGVVR